MFLTLKDMEYIFRWALCPIGNMYRNVSLTIAVEDCFVLYR